MSENEKKMIGVVVTTGEHRGVFFGYVSEIPELNESKVVKLERCRMCVYWPQDQHGVVGLAANGPVNGSRISPAAPEMTLSDVNSIMRCSESAEREWEKEKWS